MINRITCLIGVTIIGVSCATTFALTPVVTEDHKLTVSDGVTLDYLGMSVSTSGDKAIVGAGGFATESDATEVGRVVIQNGGMINGQRFGTEDSVIRVQQGDRIKGQIPIRVYNPYDSGPVFPVGATVTWGDRTKPWEVASHASSGWTDHVLKVDKRAPKIPGRYYIVIAAAPRYNINQVLSSTTAGRTAVWNDGNDLGWDWEEIQFEDARAKGFTTSRCMNSEGSYERGPQPANVITVLVIDRDQRIPNNDRANNSDLYERSTKEVSTSSFARNQQHDWYAGTWDSTLYNWSTAIHPRTIGVRVEVVDARTGRPVRNARVELGGRWEQERLGRQEFGMPAVQEKEYRLTARTNQDGIAVFGLSWLKEIPWSQERPKDPNSNGGWTAAKSWIRPVDDIEKVQELSVRHPDYNMVRGAFNFDNLTEFGQKTDTEYQLPEINENFRLGWENLIGQSGTRFCVLQVGDQLIGEPNTSVTDAVFFKKLRDEDFSITYSELPNLSGLRSPEYAGPYFVILLELELDPARNESTIIRPGGNNRIQPDQYDQHEDEDRLRVDRDERARKESERQVREERERREKEARADRERKEREEARKVAREKELRREASSHPLGLAVKTLTSARRKELGLAIGIKGVEVLYIESGSAADGEFRVHDVIVDIKHRSVQDASDFHNHTDDLESGDQILISIFRKNRNWDRMTKNVMVD